MTFGGFDATRHPHCYYNFPAVPRITSSHRTLLVACGVTRAKLSGILLMQLLGVLYHQLTQARVLLEKYIWPVIGSCQSRTFRIGGQAINTILIQHPGGVRPRRTTGGGAIFRQTIKTLAIIFEKHKNAFNTGHLHYERKNKILAMGIGATKNKQANYNS